GRLQLVQQAGDRRALLDHALADGERRDAVLAGAADDAERVVLRGAEPRGLERARDDAADDGGRAQQRDGALLPARAERPSLPDLRLDLAGSCLWHRLPPPSRRAAEVRVRLS